MRVVVVGAGDVGTYLAASFSASGNEVTVIDQSAEALRRVEENLDVMTLCGNATFRPDLQKAKIDNCDLFVSVTGIDEVNMVSAALVREMAVKKSVARVDAPAFYLNPRGVDRNVLGVSAILCASRLVSSELRRRVRQLDCDFIGNFALNSINVGVGEVADGFRHLDKEPHDIELGRHTRLVGVIREGAYRRLDEITRVYEGDRLLVSGSAEAFGMALRRLSDRFGGKRTVIIGGGDVGFQLAQGIKAEAGKVMVVDINRRRCESLSEELEAVTVIHGDGTNITMLQDEHVEAANCLIAVTRADEVNLMSSLLGKELGVGSTFALVHRPGYAQVYDRLGVTGTASSHELVGQHIHMLTTPEWIIQRKSLPGCRHEIAEVHIPEAWQGGEVRLGDLSWPTDCELLAVSHHEKIHTPEPNLRLTADTHLLFAVDSVKVNELSRTLKRVLGS